MSDVTSLDAWREKKKPHNRGEAMCRSCGHEWVAVVPHNPEGEDPNLRIQCPHCRRMMGVFKFEYALTTEEVRNCTNCRNQLFYITRAGIFCPACGRYEEHDHG